MKWRRGTILAVTLFGCISQAQSAAPERRVQGNVIISERNPKVRVRLPESAQYMGAERWVLYDIADCELHALVHADAQKTRHAMIGGWDFYVDSWIRAKGEPTRAGSDFEHMVTLVEAKGYHLPEGMMYVRFVHLLDEQKRQELMTIYAEDVAASGYSANDLEKGGKFYDRWPSIDKALVERGERSFSLEW